MHLFLILQPIMVSSLWWFHVITLPNNISNKVALWQISYPFDTRMRIANSVWWNLIVEGLLVHYPETFQTIHLFETLPVYCFERAILRLLVSTAHVANREQEWKYPLQPRRWTWWLRCYWSLPMAPPRSLPPWSLSCTSFIVFVVYISRSISYQVAPCLWR
jgi:hypothetical protein